MDGQCDFKPELTGRDGDEDREAATKAEQETVSESPCCSEEARFVENTASQQSTENQESSPPSTHEAKLTLTVTPPSDPEERASSHPNPPPTPVLVNPIMEIQGFRALQRLRDQREGDSSETEEEEEECSSITPTGRIEEDWEMSILRSTTCEWEMPMTEQDEGSEGDSASAMAAAFMQNVGTRLGDLWRAVGSGSEFPEFVFSD